MVNDPKGLAVVVNRVVGVLQSIGDADADADRHSERDGLLLLGGPIEHLGGGDPMNVLHGHEVLLVELPEVVEADDVRVVNQSAGSGLGEKEALIGALAFVFGQESLDDDKLGEAAEADPSREEDLGHAADCELLQEDVSAEFRFHRGALAVESPAL